MSVRSERYRSKWTPLHKESCSIHARPNSVTLAAMAKSCTWGTRTEQPVLDNSTGAQVWHSDMSRWQVASHRSAPPAKPNDSHAAPPRSIPSHSSLTGGGNGPPPPPSHVSRTPLPQSDAPQGGARVDPGAGGHGELPASRYDSAICASTIESSLPGASWLIPQEIPPSTPSSPGLPSPPSVTPTSSIASFRLTCVPSPTAS
jgi:hypothetical protein